MQAWFDLPVPTEFDLRQVFLTRLEEITGPAADSEAVVRLMNAFYGIVARAPEDPSRRGAAAEYPAGGVIRRCAERWMWATSSASRPCACSNRSCMLSIARNGKMLCGRLRDEGEHTGGQEELPRRAAARMCRRGGPGDDPQGPSPPLSRIGECLERAWVRRRLRGGVAQQAAHLLGGSLCDFRFGLSDETISAKELTALIERADDAAAVQGALRRGVKTSRRMGGTRAAVLLGEVVHGQCRSDRRGEGPGVPRRRIRDGRRTQRGGRSAGTFRDGQ